MTQPIPITARDYIATHPLADVTANLLRVWHNRGKITALGRATTGEQLYDLASINQQEKQRHARRALAPTGPRSV